MSSSGTWLPQAVQYWQKRSDSSVGGADVQREHGLTQRDCVGEGAHAHPVEMRHRNDGEVGDLGGCLLALAIPRSRDAERDGAGDAVEVAAGEQGHAGEGDHDQQRHPGTAGELGDGGDEEHDRRHCAARSR